jgi:hypothetical protein
VNSIFGSCLCTHSPKDRADGHAGGNETQTIGKVLGLPSDCDKELLWWARHIAQVYTSRDRARRSTNKRMVVMNYETFSAGMLEDCCSQNVVIAELEPAFSFSIQIIKSPALNME